MSDDPFIGKPLPSVGDIIRNENGLNYRVVSVHRNEWMMDLNGEASYSVTLVPFFEWVQLDAAKEGKQP